MSDEPPRQGLLDTNILILRKWINPAKLPDEMAISAITLAELSAGPHEVRRNDEQDAYDEHAERARRLEVLQRAESEFDPVPFDAEAARIYGRVTAAVIAAGRKPRGRATDLMIAATAIAEGLPLYTTNPADFTGLDNLIEVIPVTRPPVPHEKPARQQRLYMTAEPWLDEDYDVRFAPGTGQHARQQAAFEGAYQADGVNDHAMTPGDFGVGVAAGGVQHDPYTDDLPVTGGTGVGELLEPVAFGGGQDDLACAGAGTGELSRREI